MENGNKGREKNLIVPEIISLVKIMEESWWGMSD